MHGQLSGYLIFMKRTMLIATDAVKSAWLTKNSKFWKREQTCICVFWSMLYYYSSIVRMWRNPPTKDVSKLMPARKQKLVALTCRTTVGLLMPGFGQCPDTSWQEDLSCRTLWACLWGSPLLSNPVFSLKSTITKSNTRFRPLFWSVGWQVRIWTEASMGTCARACPPNRNGSGARASFSRCLRKQARRLNISTTHTYHHTHAFTHACTHTHTGMCTHTGTRTHTCPQTHTYTKVYTCYTDGHKCL